MKKSLKITLWILAAGALVAVLIFAGHLKHKPTPVTIKTDSDTGLTFPVDKKTNETTEQVGIVPLRNITDVSDLLTNNEILILRQKLGDFAKQKNLAATLGARVLRGSLVKKADGSFSFKVMFDDEKTEANVSVKPAGYREVSSTITVL